MKKPPAFKNLELGPIPADWEVKRLGEILTFKNGFNAPAKAYGKGVPFISVLDILDNHPITRDSIRGKVCVTDKNRENFSVQDGDMFFMRSSETLEDVGTSNVFTGECDVAVFGGFVIRGRPFVEVDSVFLNYLLKDESHRQRIAAQGAGAQHFNIGQTGLSNVEITLPPLPEQHRIAAALSDADAWIESLDKLIEKKKLVKQGAMQALLSGKTRLPGFSGEWVEKRLGEIGESIRGVGFRPNQSSQTSMPNSTKLLRANNIQDSSIILEDVVYVQNECIADVQKLQKGDILICAANGSRNLVGKAAVWSQNTSASFGAFMAVFRCTQGVDASFVGYLFQTASYRRQLDDILTGSAINNLNARDIEGLVFQLPSLAEQKAVASILSDIDTELSALFREKAKAERIKEGMMQELLTGRVRLTGGE